ncbi:MAG: hypothetical protein H6613_08110 [Ignavibacteriales bacterium]|nr:hypothetical protein [Ignavibacteriales bacterium]
MRKKKSEFLNLLNNSFIISKSDFIEDRIKFLNQLKDEIKKFYYSIEDEQITKLKKITLSREFHSQIKTFLDREKKSFASENFEENFKEYHSNIEAYINSLPQTLEKPQEENNFKCSEENSAFICTLLKIKNFYFSIKQRKNKDYTLWKRIIPYKNINQYYFNHKLNEKLLDLTYETNNSIAKEYIFLFKEFLNEFEKIFNLIAAENAEKNENEENSFSSNIDTAIGNVVLLKENINSKLPEIIEPIVDEYKVAIDKAGTVESIFKNYSVNDIKKIKDVETLKNNQEKRRLERFTNGLFNNWNFYEDISLLNYFINEEFVNSKNKIEENLEKNIVPKFERIIQIFDEIKIEVNAAKDKTDLAQLIKGQQQKLKTTLSDDLIVELMRIMPLNNPAPLINSFNIKVKDYIEKFPGNE